MAVCDTPRDISLHWSCSVSWYQADGYRKGDQRHPVDQRGLEKGFTLYGQL